MLSRVIYPTQPQCISNVMIFEPNQQFTKTSRQNAAKFFPLCHTTLAMNLLHTKQFSYDVSSEIWLLCGSHAVVLVEMWSRYYFFIFFHILILNISAQTHDLMQTARRCSMC